MSKSDKVKTQKDRVLDYVKDHGSITGAEAFYHLGIAHLPSVMRDLRVLGYATSSVWESRENKYGKVDYKRYYLSV